MTPDIHKWATLKPQNTALLVIDIQNDFCSPQGKAAQKSRQISKMQNIIGNLDIFIHKINEAGVLVIFTKFVSGPGITPENLNIAIRKEGFDIPCVKGSGGEQFYKLKPPETALILEKPHYDSFAHTNLKQILSDRKIKNILVTGVRTEVCVDATAKRAASEGFDAFIVSDLVATYDDKQSIHDGVLDFFRKYYGFVADSQSILDEIRNLKNSDR
jgi:ureidoacrylate peracid hydrolase